jgi:alcohol dehydrogenase
VNPSLAPRWDRARRTANVCALLNALNLERLITHTIRFDQIEDAYRLIDTPPDDLIQVVLEYDNSDDGNGNVSVV